MFAPNSTPYQPKTNIKISFYFHHRPIVFGHGKLIKEHNSNMRDHIDSCRTHKNTPQSHTFTPICVNPCHRKRMKKNNTEKEFDLT